MNKRLKIFGNVSAVVAFSLCLIGGAWLFFSNIGEEDNVLGVTLGLYFMGKAFFVGPMLYLTTMAKAND